MRSQALQRGFTLIELIMVIVLLGVIGGMVSVFMKSPIDAYVSGSRRAELTDTADTTVRRIARDLQRALPNSVRTSGTSCIEFIPTKTGARYRTQDNLAGDSLDFTASDTTFNMLGSNSTLPSDQQIAANDLIVVYNLGIPGSDAYDVTNALGGKNWTTVSGAPSEPPAYSPVETIIPITGFRFPLASPGSRFQVVPSAEQMVSYVCSGTNLLRAVSAAPTASASCPTVTGGAVSIIATHVNCAAASTYFTYSGPDLQRNALVTMVLTIQDSSTTESISLQHEVHVSNTP